MDFFDLITIDTILKVKARLAYNNRKFKVG